MISRDSLVIWLEECKESGESKTALLISQLIETYDQLESERASKSAIIKASAGALKESAKKDEYIVNLVAAIEQQQEKIGSAIAAFRKIYEISVYGNEFFKSEKLLRLWSLVDRYTGSKNNEEMAKNSLEMMAMLQELQDDPYLMDMRNNLIVFTDFQNASNEANDESIEKFDETIAGN